MHSTSNGVVAGPLPDDDVVTADVDSAGTSVIAVALSSLAEGKYIVVNNREIEPVSAGEQRPKSLFGLSLWVGAGMLAGLLILVMINTRANYIQTLNSSLPDLDLQPLLNVQDVPKRGDFKGKITVLHFWGVWCGPCLAEYPEFAKVYQSYADNQEVQFFSVSCSPGVEDNLDQLAAQTEKYLESLDVEMPVYCDPAAFSRLQIGLILPGGSLGYPTTMVIDRDGMVRAFWEGAATPAELTTTIDKFIKG